MKAFSAFFMCPVSHTFPACNGNEMPPWYTKVPVVYKPRCLLLCFLCGTFRQFARAHERLSPQCPGTPRVKPHEKSRLFSDRGAKLFYGQRFSANLFFFCARFCGVAWAWKGPFPVAVSHHGTGKKSGFPGLCQPVAHAWEPKPNPVIFRPKLSGFPRVAATTRGFSPVRTYRNFPPPCGAN